MKLLTIILISIALAMDAFAVSIASGIAIKRLRIKHALIIASWFGLFQALMPVIGWLLGSNIKDLVAEFDHWIIFGLLAFIGCKMIYESFQIDPIENKNPLDIHVLFLLSIATSLDAFAVGISFAILSISIIKPILLIGLITFVMSFVGVWLGDMGKHFFEKKIEIVAGLVLIGIGIKVLLTHLIEG